MLEDAREELKQLLLKEVSDFYKSDNRRWKEPITQTLHDLQQSKVKAVIFGGTLRSLLVSRLFNQKPGRPRDVDIVVADVSLEALRERFENIISRETRFGGLQLRRKDWQFDVWPLQQTWAFVKDDVCTPTFDALPHTTFFNLEAIAVELWAEKGQFRKVFSGNDQFFDGILSETLEINRKENPFPQLCVIRAFAMSVNLNFKIGPLLAEYISEYGINLTDNDVNEIQMKHYGYSISTNTIIRNWIEQVAKSHKNKPFCPVDLHVNKQLELWDNPNQVIHFRIHKLLGKKQHKHDYQNANTTA